MSNIIPLTLRPHLVKFLAHEMKGETKTFAGFEVGVYDISRKSFIGRFLLEHLEKINYPVRNIARFNFFVEVKAAHRKRKYLSAGAFYKKEALGETFVQLPAQYVEDVNDLFEEQFRLAFYNYVSTRAEEDHMRITQSIILFMDKYGLFEGENDQEQLRKLYYRMRGTGLCAGLQGKLYRG